MFGPPPKREKKKKKGVQFRNPERIRDNLAIRANLRIDSRESGHLSCKHCLLNSSAELQFNVSFVTPLNMSFGPPLPSHT